MHDAASSQNARVSPRANSGAPFPARLSEAHPVFRFSHSGAPVSARLAQRMCRDQCTLEYRVDVLFGSVLSSTAMISRARIAV